MNYDIESRAVLLARHIIETGNTVRDTAKVFGISKSTVHKDVTERLMRSNPEMYTTVKEILDKNKAERHLRGGEATRQKFNKTKKYK